jgi:hypothetical protein
MELYVTAYNVDLLDLIDNLDEKQSGLLFDYLAQKQTANEVARPKILIDHELFVDINVYDMCNELGDWEIDEIIEYLERRGYLDNLNDDVSEESPSTPEEIFAEGTRPLEQELGMMLNQLWESRDYLSTDQKARIEAITKESYI